MNSHGFLMIKSDIVVISCRMAIFFAVTIALTKKNYNNCGMCGGFVCTFLGSAYNMPHKLR